MNQIVTNKTNKKIIMRQTLRKRKPRLALRAALLALCALIFVVPTMAQQTSVYMKDGSRTIQRNEGAISFYDSHGPSQQTNYWEKWYSHNENYTYVFKPAVTGDKIKVTFNSFRAYGEPDDPNSAIGEDLGNWTLRLNDDYLYIYNGNGAVEANLIATLTGNTRQGFSVMSDGPITFKFVSNAQYREEGWYATVELVQGNMAAQAPLIQSSTCSDQVEIFPTTQNARIIYSIGDNDPDPSDPLAPPTYEYTAPISFPEGTIPSTGFKVNAMSQLATGGPWSSVTHAVFQESDRVPLPDDDDELDHTTITRVAGANTIVMTPAERPDGLNDTYVVRYTVSTNGNEPAEPTLNNSQLYTGPITASVNGTIYRAKTFAVSCSNQCSAESVRYVVEGIYAPTPVIDFDAMTITAVDAGGTTFEILYTLDGTMPAEVNPNDPDNMPIGIYSATQVSLTGLTPGQTVRAMAYRSNDDEWHTCNYSYIPSQVVTAVYVPSTGSGTYNNALVLLDDREDHNWSYYSDETSPIKKLSPADIKITYYGNSPAGRTTMTNASENGNTPTSFSAVASGVAVNHDAPESQFIYLKTLEAANEDGSGGYPYTMIANPFQKRPTLASSTTERTFVVTLRNRDEDDNWNGHPADGTPATVTVSFSNGGSQQLYGPSSSTYTTPVSYSFTKPIGTTVTVTFDKGDQQYPTWCQAAIAYQDGETIYANQNCPSSSGQLTQFTVAAASGNEANKYRGFYAWRIKSLSPGLSISGKSVGQTINADEEIVFETTNDYGNEVEFEALWAQAYVTTGTSTSGLNSNVSYERNFMVLGSSPSSNVSTKTVGSGTGTNNGQRLPIYVSNSNYPYSVTQQIYTPTEIGASGSITSIAFYVGTARSSSRTLEIYLNSSSSSDFEYDDGNYYTQAIRASHLVYSGTQNFNSTGWRTITLDTPFEYDGTSYLLVSVIDKTGSYMGTPPTFRTYSASNRGMYGAFGTSPDVNTYQLWGGTRSSYINQMQFTFTSSPISDISVPLTITTYNPDGTGGSTSVTLPSNGISCSADLRIENIKMNAIPTLSANGKNLFVGRGVTPSSSNGLCASYVKGLNSNATSPNYKIRLESGVYDIVSMIDGYTGNESNLTVSGTPRVWLVLGSDYDRAKEKYTNGSMTITDKLDVKTTVTVGRSVTIGSESMMGEETFKTWVKSGKICSSHDMSDYDADFTETLYMSSHGTATYAGYRKLFIEGGEIAGVAGGMDHCYSSTTTHGTNKSLTIRMTNGHVRSAIYGGAAQVPSGGDKEIIVTGGVVTGWIGAGCNGTLDTDGQTYGEGSIYFGGDAISGGNGSSNLTNNVQGGVIFGAGAGRATSTTTGEMTFGTKVVIADECNVEHNVYGGGNYGYAVDYSDVYVLGGLVQGNVFGGANQKQGPVVNVTMKDGTVNGSVYGGSNTTGTISGLATINVSGGMVKGSVYGGGYGSSTTMSTNGTKVTVTGGSIINNVYGGGEQGIVQGATIVSFEGGTVKNIYGAGKGTQVTPGSAASANVAQNTTVNVKGGLVNGDVYGGGEYGTVAFASGNGTSNYSSTVSISGGEVKGDVLGGGKMGTTQGKTIVNVSGTWDGTIIRGNVFAGAYGEHDVIYVAGLKTLNISGGRIYGSVYGGSRNANDGNTLNATGGTNTTSITNISGGRIDQHVYAAGYYGSTKGSVYAFIGLNAINEAPNSPHSASGATLYAFNKGPILIAGSVWAGGDWGVFSGSFGAPTVSGNSNIYINGEGYSTDGNDQSADNYMNIQSSIFGCGTSCDAGAVERTLILKHYGADVANSGPDSDENPFSSTSRQLNTIQRFHNVIFDDAKVGFVGQGKINSLNNTEKYAIYEIDQNVYLANGSTMVMNVPTSQIYSFHSVTCPDTYAANPSYTPVNYDGLGETGGETDNKIRVNGGSYIEIKYIPEGEPNGVIPDPEENVTVDFETGDLSQLTNTNSGISYTNDATYPWTVVSNGQSGFNGTYCMKSGNGGQASTESSITVTAVYEEDGTISFMGGCWGEGTSYDVCRFNIDDQQQFSIGNAQSWNTYTYSVSAGTHTFTWNYKKDYSVNPDGDAFFVDDIVFTGVHVQNSGEDPEPVYYAGYGQLEGFAHMMAGNPDEDATCAYARPKQSTEEGNILVDANVFNPSDGGWVSYNDEDNEYDADGGLASETEEEGVQLRYENHHPNMRDNSEYYRIWRKGSDHHTVEAVANVHANGNTGVYNTVEIEVELPSWRAAGSYYRFDRTDNPGDNNTLIDYGSDVMCFNGANYSNPLGAETWMYFDSNADQQVTGVTASNATVAAAIGQNGILSNPNLNFGLVIKPGLTMESSDINYIINSEADTYLASVEKPFNCHDNTHKPTIKLVITYSDELSANATLDPVLITLVQCDAQGNITDYVTIKLIINTSMNITSGFTTQIYARMDGSANTRETAMVPVVLPTFNVAEAGENAKFYLQKVEFIQNGGVVIQPAVHGNSVVCAEARESASSSGTALNIDRFAMTIAALANPDNSDDWRNITGPQDAVQQPNSGYGTLIWGGSNNRGVHLGDGKGRSPLAFGFTMYFNANEQADGKSKMGDMVFTILVENMENGSGTNHTMTFTITIEVYRLGPGENFYVDGINGQDLDDADRAKFPDKSAKTINFIFNRLGYMPGDNIFVVNTLPVSKITTWDGSKFQNNVKIYRYPGGHRLTTGTTSTESNPNEPYLGPLVDVTKTLNMKGVIMDGMYAESTTPLEGVHNPKLYPTGDAGDCTYDGIANAPLITISNGGRANFTNTTLQNNYNNNSEKVNAGGAVHVTYDGILAMNDANRITANYNVNGGGVYVDGSMIVSDHAYVFDNYTGAISGSKDDPEQNNVMLAPVDGGTFRVVQLGTSDANDAYDELLQTDDDGETKIGVTKDDWDHGYDGYMPVTYAESGSLTYLNDPYNTQSMVVHDGGKYKLERYVTSQYADSPNYLYWLETWVTAVTWNPYFESREDNGYTDYFTEAQLKDIHEPEQLAWAISIVNGENGCTPRPNTNFTLTDDIDMHENIWVPIGEETSMYNGNFNGNGHVVTGLRGTITRTDMGMFGRTNTDANIHDMVVSTKFNTNSDNLGTVVGNMTGGTLSNVEGAGENTSRNSDGTNGGLVGINNGTIHSCFSVATIKGGATMGGLVAVNRSDLFNSYCAADISEGTSMAGLVADNNGRVENCYDATNADVAFAVKNNGIIRYCYTAEVDENEDIDYVDVPVDGSTLEKYGTYGDVKGIKELGYMYGDNKVTAAANETIGYVKTTHEYLNGHTVVWDGLLSVLNQWVADDEIEGKPSGLSTWNRPLTQTLNGDLPVLAFPKDNCLGNLAAEDGKMLYYSAFNINPDTEAGETFNNGLDHLLGDVYNGKAANIFLYQSTKEVESGTVSNNLFINEDAALIQKATNGEYPVINATVGITFDNSDHGKTSYDLYGNKLLYDWHMMSTPLANAPLGATYDESATMAFGTPVNIQSLEGSYFPNGLISENNPAVGGDLKWDLYSYFEPQYHWINLKRSTNNHWHIDGSHEAIVDSEGNNYQNETIFVPGKGYMMAINQDSYLSSTGILNTGGETIEITNQEPLSPTYNKGWNLVGNPYQAYLDLTKVTSTKNQFYIYDAEQGLYVPYTVGQSANSVTPSRYIHPHQAFFMYSADASSEYVFNYAWATTDKAEDGSSYFRGGENQLNYPLVNLFVENQQGNRDLTIIEFNRPELGGATKVKGLHNADFKIAASLDGVDYGILFTPEGTERIPVHFQTEQNGTYTLTWNMQNGDFTSLRLIDNKTGVNYDMLANDSYTFEASADDFTSRFYITYTVTGLDEEVVFDSNSFAFFNGSEWVINGKGRLDVIDMTGRVLYAAQLSSDQNRVNLDGFAKGVYLLRVIDNKVVRTQKIIVR